MSIHYLKEKMEPVPILESPAPAKWARTIKIDGVEYAYSINQNQEEKCVNSTKNPKKR